MKIGIITNLYPPHVRGGAENVIVRTVEGLTERNHDVFVITSKPRDGEGITKSRTAVERIYRFFPTNLYFVLNDNKFPALVRMFWHIIDALSPIPAWHTEGILEEERPDIVMTHNLKGIGLRIPRMVQHLRIPHIHIVHDLQLIYPSGILFAGHEKKPAIFAPMYALYRATCKWLMGKPDLVIFPSRYLHEEYLKHGFFKDTRVEVMPNPAPDFKAVPRNNMPEGPMTLLFVGQLEDHKGITFLLDAVAEYEKPIQLIVAGEGTLSREVQRRADQNSNLNYLGYIAIDQLISCFGIADVLVVPSLCYENSPTVIYESLQAGVPVLASDIGGVGELVQNGKNGFLFAPGSRGDFYRALGDVEARRTEFAKSEQELKNTVAEFALSQYTEKLLGRIESVIASKNKDAHSI